MADDLMKGYLPKIVAGLLLLMLSGVGKVIWENHNRSVGSQNKIQSNANAVIRADQKHEAEVKRSTKSDDDTVAENY